MFVCSDCGQDYSKWQGRCTQCGAWNTIKQITTEQKTVKGKSRTPPLNNQREAVVRQHEIPIDQTSRIEILPKELSRTLGGFMPGGSYLLSGDPGIGKSTLLLQIANSFPGESLYISGEESLPQIKDRILRLNLSLERLSLTKEKRVPEIGRMLSEADYQLVLVDSAQTLYDPEYEGSPGSAVQLRLTASRMIEICKQKNIVLVMSGHINKAGEIAGPKLLEHLVDATVQLSSNPGLSRFRNLRILSPIKNRFHSTEVSTLWSMEATGLKPFEGTLVDKQALEEQEGALGTCLFPHILAGRVLFVETQALVVPGNPPAPMRSPEGIPLNRLNRLIALLEKYSGMTLASQDVYVNVQPKIDDPELDLAIAAALLSSLRQKAIPSRLLFVGELSLSGRIKAMADRESLEKHLKSLGAFTLLGADKELRNLPELQAFFDKI